MLEKTIEFPDDQAASGRSFGREEMDLLEQALLSGTLTSTKGQFVKSFEQRFAALHGVRHALACASGSAAVHCAVAAIDPEPGEEIITTPITDMGALTPILFQGAIPVFADVDPRSYNLTADSIASVISERTRAIVVTHLFGHPAEMAAIRELGEKHGIPIIEDCAQAFLAETADGLVGTTESIGCFSLQQGKHITTGEGGVLTTNDYALYQRMKLFVNKAWGYGDPQPDHYFLALNYRLSELQGAVALGQLEKLENNVSVRRKNAQLLSQLLADVPGIETPASPSNSRHSYWRYCLDIDPGLIPEGPDALANALGKMHVSSAPRYIQKPAFECAVFRDRQTFGNSRWPFTLARPEALDYRRERFPGAYRALERILVLPWNERYLEIHVKRLASAIEAACRDLAGRA
ncbi:MAG: DegT/DnrJ/EryC1/StrS family aminotransferase [Hyphomicrobiales bacterium]|nr:DegT/DnrJ/EryC1/StrS family aminotransferase [Hyphomicrobiales bacterium]